MSESGVETSYLTYLKLSELLSLQERMSERAGDAAHDEMLFIIVHQAYELWFKQLLFEVESVIEILGANPVDERSISVAVSRLKRMVVIEQLLVHQVEAIETISPLDFLEFRPHLGSYSGFQSVQFRLLELRLGLKPAERISEGVPRPETVLPAAELALLEKAGSEPTLFSCLETWLERLPLLAQHDFTSVLEESSYQQLSEQSGWRLSYRATLAALLVNLYREEPLFHLPSRLLHAVSAFDEELSMWRFRHALMVQRMLGQRLGTGGSSGAKYLSATVERHRIFQDFANLAGLFVPRSKVPPLPDALKASLGFSTGGSVSEP